MIDCRQTFKMMLNIGQKLYMKNREIGQMDRVFVHID